MDPERLVKLTGPRKLSSRGLEPDTAPRPKKPHRTYSQRTVVRSERGSTGTSNRVDEKRGIPTVPTSTTATTSSSVVTPLLRRARFFHLPNVALPDNNQPSPQRSEPVQGRLRPSRSNLTASLKELSVHRTKLGEAKYAICQGILRDLAVVLQAVKATEAADAKSLLSMCLRKLPSHAAMIAQRGKDRSSDTAALVGDPFLQVYDELETLGHEAMGWKYMSIVVRSHSLMILTEATADGVFPPCVVGILARFYRCYGYHDDALDLLETMVSQVHPGPRGPQSTFGEHESLEKLSVYADACDSTKSHVPDSCLLRLVLCRQELPLAWLSTRGFRSCWARLAVSLSGGHTSATGLQLLQSAIAALCSSQPFHRELQHGTAPEDRALVAVVGAMVSIALVTTGSFNWPHKDPDLVPSYQQVRKTVLRVLRGALYETFHYKTRPQAVAVLQLGIFFLADSYKSEFMGGILQWPRMTSRLSVTSDEVCELAATLICSITRCSSRALSRPPHYICSWLCDQLQAARILRHKTIRADAAFMLAGETDDLRDLVFAEAVRSTAVRQRETPRGGGHFQQTSVFAGYRWEEGISEWVVNSPEVRKRPRSASDSTTSGPQQNMGVHKPLFGNRQRSGMIHGGLEDINGHQLRRQQRGQITPRMNHVLKGSICIPDEQPHLPVALGQELPARSACAVRGKPTSKGLENDLAKRVHIAGTRLRPLAPLLTRKRSSVEESEDELLA